jgi:hypothetical protein
MRASEAAMTLASVDTEAARLWRNNRRDYSKFTAEDFASMLARTGAQ